MQILFYMFLLYKLNNVEKQQVKEPHVFCEETLSNIFSCLFTGESETVAYAAHCQQEADLDRPIAGHTNICPSALNSTDNPVNLKEKDSYYSFFKMLYHYTLEMLLYLFIEFDFNCAP